MSSHGLKPIIAEAPLDWRSRWRLTRIVRKARSRKFEYTFEHLLAAARTIDPEVLSMILADLVDHGLAERIIKIVSPFTHGGLMHCHSLEEIPLTIPDADGVSIPVTLDMLKVVYKF